MFNESAKNISPEPELISDRQTNGKAAQWTKVSQPEPEVLNEAQPELNANEPTDGEPEALPAETTDETIKKLLRETQDSGVLKSLQEKLVPLVKDPVLKKSLEEAQPKINEDDTTAIEPETSPKQIEPADEDENDWTDYGNDSTTELTEEQKDALYSGNGNNWNLTNNNAPSQAWIDADNDNSTTGSSQELNVNDVDRTLPKTTIAKQVIPTDSSQPKRSSKWTQNGDGSWTNPEKTSIVASTDVAAPKITDEPAANLNFEQPNQPDANENLTADNSSTDYQSAISNDDDEENRFEDFKNDEAVPGSYPDLNDEQSTSEPTPKVELSSYQLLANKKIQIAENMLNLTKRVITPEQKSIIKSSLHGFSPTKSFLSDLGVWVEKTNDLENPKFTDQFRKKYSKNENAYLNAFEIVKNLNQKDLEHDGLFDSVMQVKIINHIIEVIADPKNYGTFEAGGTGKPLGN